MSRDRIGLVVAAAIGLLIASFLLWRGCARKPEPRKSSSKQVAISKPKRRIDDPSPVARVQSGPTQTDRTATLAWVERLGRAVIFRDRHTLAELKESIPAFYEQDLPWLFELLQRDLFTAAGAAELLRWFRLSSAVPELAAMIRGSVHAAAKDVAVAALATIGGDGARVVLLELLAGYPESSIRARAAQALAQLPEASVAYALIQALRSDPDLTVRRSAAEALQEMASKEMIDLLLGLVATEADVRVATEAAIAVYAAGGEERLYELLETRPDVAEALRNDSKLSGAARFSHSYDASFFQPGGAAVSFREGWRRIGITVDPGSLRFADAIGPLFQTSPLDRYTKFFFVRIESEFAQDLASGHALPRAYDVEGRPIEGGIPPSDSDGTVHLRFRDPKEFAPGVLGFTEGKEAFVTQVSLLHEFGHAFAQLADEYDHPLASNAGEANVDPPGRPPKWQPLIAQGHLSEPSPRGDRVVPSSRCHMNNHPTDDRWCPVCQLEILSRLCERSGAPVPW